MSNRTLRATGAGAEAWSYDANDRLTADASAAYTYDANGNVTAKTDAAGTTLYTWDAEDRLIAVAAPGQPLVEHAYDHAGNRVETRVGGAVTRYLVDANRGLAQVLEERDGAGALVASYVHGEAGEPLSRLDGASSAASHYLHDAQGSVRQLADGAGAITDAYDYSAFGEERAALGATPNPYRYGGQWLEATSRLYHLRARWMDPRVGRFLSTDPFPGVPRSPISLHRYGYANQGPVTFGDPSGLWSLSELSIVQSANSALLNVYARAAVFAIQRPLLARIGGLAITLVAGSLIPPGATIGLPNGAALSALQRSEIRFLSFIKSNAVTRALTQQLRGLLDDATGKAFEKFVATNVFRRWLRRDFVLVPGKSGHRGDFDLVDDLVEVKSGASVDSTQLLRYAEASLESGKGFLYLFLQKPGAAVISRIKTAGGRVGWFLED